MEATADELKGEDLIVKLGKIEEDIRFLRDQRNECNLITKESLTKRNEINDEINQNLTKAKEFMNKRDELNINVKELKKKRKELQNLVQEKKEILDDLVEKEETIDKSNINRKRRSMRNLNGQINKLEWELQTSVLEPEQEKEMVQQLEKLSDQLNKIAEEVHNTTQQTQLWKEVSSAQKQLNVLHVQIIDFAKESQIYHNLMNQNFYKVNSLRKKANDFHKQFLGNKKQADNFHRDFLAKVTEKNELRGKLKEYKQRIRKEMQETKQANLEESTKKAFEKYEKGENLTLDEFRLLVEKGMI